MHTPSSHMNGGSHYEFNQWDSLFMSEERARIYGIPRVHNSITHVKRRNLYLWYFESIQ